MCCCFAFLTRERATRSQNRVVGSVGRRLAVCVFATPVPMRRSVRLLGALALATHASAHLEFGNYKEQQLADEVTSFLVTGEWGGQSQAPFTTPGQLSAAAAMSAVATSSASTFVLSPGGNFYDDGIQGACGRRGSAPEQWVQPAPPHIWCLRPCGRAAAAPTPVPWCTDTGYAPRAPLHQSAQSRLACGVYTPASGRQTHVTSAACPWCAFCPARRAHRLAGRADAAQPHVGRRVQHAVPVVERPSVVYRCRSG